MNKVALVPLACLIVLGCTRANIANVAEDAMSTSTDVACDAGLYATGQFGQKPPGCRAHELVDEHEEWPYDVALSVAYCEENTVLPQEHAARAVGKSFNTEKAFDQCVEQAFYKYYRDRTLNQSTQPRTFSN